MAAEAGQLQLNAFRPLMAWALHKSLHHLAHACGALQKHCVEASWPTSTCWMNALPPSVTLVTARTR